MIVTSGDRRVANAEQAFRIWAGRRLSLAQRDGVLFSATRVAEHLEPAPGRRAWSGRARIAAIAALLAACVAIATAFVPSSVAVLEPGPLVTMGDAMPSAATPTGTSRVMGATIQSRPVSLLRRVTRWGLSGRQVAPRERRDREARAHADLVYAAAATHAQYLAAVADHRRVSFTGTGASVYEVSLGSIAALGGMTPRDTVVSVDGRRVRTTLELNAAINRALRARDARIVLGTREGALRTLRIPPGEFGSSMRINRWSDSLGFMAETADPRIVGGDVMSPKVRDGIRLGGSSAGLTFALGLYQRAGHAQHAPAFAATGEVYPDGSVGSAPACALQAQAAQAGGIEYFLAPTRCAQEARGAAPGLRVVPIDTFDQARAWADSWNDAGGAT